MNNNHQDIEKALSEISFRTLSNEEQARVLSSIVAVQKKPLLFNSNKNFMYKSIIIALVLAVGLGGTVALADNSVPGDPLFGIDRAVENLRLSLASSEKKNELRISFAGERVKEIERITTSSPSMSRPAATDVTESTVTRIEADVFTNETVIKIEYGTNKKFVFTSNAKTRVLVVEDVNKNFTVLSKAFIETKLDFKAEDRSSRADDRDSSSDISSEDKIRVTTGINAAISLLNSVSASLDANSSIRLKAITDELNRYLGTLPPNSTVDVRIDSDDDDESRIDLRTVDGRIRIEMKDGEIKIKTKDDDKSSVSSNNNGSRDDDDDDDEGDDDSRGSRDDDNDDDNGGAIIPLPPVPAPITTTSYTMTDVKLHNVQSNCWTTVNGSVYDVTSWISQHPGGSAAIASMCGVDASSAFNGQHGGQSRPVSELASFKIGVLK
ncbi:MAG: cytochrome b5 domain-containing protein [Patescibacteria group bacterium]